MGAQRRWSPEIGEQSLTRSQAGFTREVQQNSADDHRCYTQSCGEIARPTEQTQTYCLGVRNDNQRHNEDHAQQQNVRTSPAVSAAATVTRMADHRDQEKPECRTDAKYHTHILLTAINQSNSVVYH